MWKNFKQTEVIISFCGYTLSYDLKSNHFLFVTFEFCSFPGKAIGVRIASHSAPAEATPAKEAEKVCITIL